MPVMLVPVGVFTSVEYVETGEKAVPRTETSSGKNRRFWREIHGCFWVVDLTDIGDEVACGKVASGNRVSADVIIKVNKSASRDFSGSEAVSEAGVS